jgi:adenylate cyclase class 2
MNTEYEIRILNIDVDKVINNLLEMGATKVGEYNQRRYVYDLVKGNSDKFIRVRDNGEKVTITYKDKTIRTISGTKELEMKIEDFDKANELLNILGYNNGHYVENKRITYKLEDAEVDIDTYPDIPTYMEIEGKDEETVRKYIDKLELNEYEQTCDSLVKVYKRYGIDITDKHDLVFKEGK